MDQNQEFFLIFAVGKQNEFGTGLCLPWPRLSTDMRHFRAITKNTKDSRKCNAVIMGWRTWLSIGKKPLSERINIVVTKTPTVDHTHPEVMFVDSVAACYSAVEDCGIAVESAFIVGGIQLIHSFLAEEQRARIRGAHITYIDQAFSDATHYMDMTQIDKHFPSVVSSTERVDAATHIRCRFVFRQ
jgi:dihydrofolate reductase